MIEIRAHEVLGFDCYGTLIDWEQGVVSALRPVLARRDISLNDNRIVVRHLGQRLGFVPSAAEVDCLVRSLPTWKPFPDSVEALRAFKTHFKPAIISNVDNDLVSSSAAHLEVAVDWIITAEQARTYKPSLNNFTVALARFSVPSEKVLHVAQNLYHDIIPAKALGFSTVWVNRRKGKEGLGATPPASAHPDLEVPDLATLATMAHGVRQ